MGLMMKASSQARKKVRRMSPKNPIASAAMLTAAKKSTTVPRTRIAVRSRRSRLPGPMASIIAAG
jgi:hypothetical protein